MVNYGNGLIYKLCCNDTNIKDEYVGSTTDFTERKRSHKRSCNNSNYNKYNLNVYKIIRENGGFENWSMIQIEKFPCENKRELETRERHWIETLKSKLNCSIPTRTKKEYRTENVDKIKEKNKEYYIENADKLKEKNKEWRTENVDKIKEQMKEYYIENADKIKEKNKEYYIENADKIKEKNKEWRTENADKIKEQMKEYYIENADKLKEKRKEYRTENADKLKEKRKEKITCECGSVICKDSLAKHRKSSKHLKLMSNK